uniref:FecR domain-containing protein n=1 Tax=Pseudomonas veronii TaxID=76761 RepID=UPI003C7D4002
MTTQPLPDLPAEVIDEAINWSIKLSFNDPDASTQMAFEQWLGGCAEHALAWSRIQSLSGQFAGLPKEAVLETLNKLPEARLQRRQLFKLLTVLVGVGASTWATREIAPWQRLVADYSTMIGEHRQWTLADASVLDLNTDSAVQLRFSDQQRLIILLRGEIALVTGSDRTSAIERPLCVQTPSCVLQALGTRFDVRLKHESTLLSVSEGAVSINQPAGGKSIIAHSGESWLVERSGAIRLPPRPAQHTAWRDGMVIARDMPLAGLLDELSRYRVGYLGCDPQIAQLPVSGNFSTTMPEETLKFVAQSHHLSIQRLTRYWVRLIPS